MQKLLMAGFVIILAGLLLVFAGSLDQGSVSTGGAIFIGPFPIVFGSGPNGSDLALGSVLIGGVMAALLLLWGWRLSKTFGGEG